MSPTKHDRFYFDDGNVIFLVEETLFNIHRYLLKRDSPVFQDMFSMHSDEGRSDDSPILIEGTKSTDFACFLACLYPSSFGEVDEMHPEEWAAVLDLAIKWQFLGVRKLAVKQMASLTVDSPTLALQIATARKHHIDSWYLDAVVKMCERSRPISPEEGERLGLLETIRISAMRQKLHSRDERFSDVCPVAETATDLRRDNIDIVTPCIMAMPPSTETHQSRSEKSQSYRGVQGYEDKRREEQPAAKEVKKKCK
ncbi:hypothetical protein EVJ58_g4557 [Rhodofomes roseus]|uniref:BTB domain-containing protein n=1 Tax=Rhodofomes roseus TaxID=34475 RepID=A0A4Y9YH73_9APHY|nr:hypothetical protein EVJ58_g4557 [Rhodofomes roseus]